MAGYRARRQAPFGPWRQCDVNVTFLGHAGMYIETKRGSILCDPFFNPAYFGSWFPYPANDRMDVSP